MNLLIYWYQFGIIGRIATKRVMIPRKLMRTRSSEVLDGLLSGSLIPVSKKEVLIAKFYRCDHRKIERENSDCEFSSSYVISL